MSRTSQGCDQQRPSRWESEAGASLLEVVVVFVILVAAAAAARPATLRSTVAAEHHRVVSEIAATLRHARTRAIVSNQEIAFVLQPEARTWRLGESAPRLLPAELQATMTAASALARSDGEVPLVFFPDGTASGGTLVLTGSARTARIAVDWLSGAVAISWGAP